MMGFLRSVQNVLAPDEGSREPAEPDPTQMFGGLSPEQAAENAKEQGNAAFKAGDYQGAADLYRSGLGRLEQDNHHKPLRSTLFSNLAAALLTLGLKIQSEDAARRLRAFYEAQGDAERAEAAERLLVRHKDDVSLFFRKLAGKYADATFPPPSDREVTKLLEAEEAAAGALAWDAGNEKARVRLARAQAALGRMCDAVSTLSDPAPATTAGAQELRALKRRVKAWGRKAALTHEDASRDVARRVLERQNHEGFLQDVAAVEAHREAEAARLAAAEERRLARVREREQSQPCLFAPFPRLPLHSFFSVCDFLSTQALGRLGSINQHYHEACARRARLCDRLRSSKSVPRRELFIFPKLDFVSAVDAAAAQGVLVAVGAFGRTTTVLAPSAASFADGPLVRTGEVEAEEVGEQPVLVALSPDGAHLATLDRSMRLRLRDLASEGPGTQLTGPDGNDAGLPVAMGVTGIGVTRDAVVLGMESCVLTWQRPSLRLLQPRAVGFRILTLKVCQGHVVVATACGRILRLVGQSTETLLGGFSPGPTPLFDSVWPVTAVATRRGTLQVFGGLQETLFFLSKPCAKPQRRPAEDAPAFFAGFDGSLGRHAFDPLAWSPSLLDAPQADSDSDLEEDNGGWTAVSVAPEVVLAGRRGHIEAFALDGQLLRRFNLWLTYPRCVFVFHGAIVAVTCPDGGVREVRGAERGLSDSVWTLAAAGTSVVGLILS